MGQAMHPRPLNAWAGQGRAGRRKWGLPNLGRRSPAPARCCGCARSTSEGQAKVTARISSWQTPAPALAQPSLHSLCMGHLRGDIPPAAPPAHLHLPVVGKSLPWHSRSLINLQQGCLGFMVLFTAKILPAHPSVPGTLSPRCWSCCHKGTHPVWMLRGH